jgi:hypothetical protein
MAYPAETLMSALTKTGGPSMIIVTNLLPNDSNEAVVSSRMARCLL